MVNRIREAEDLINPNVVKVVLNKAGEALYFSRQAIPYVRDHAIENWLNHGAFYKHVGMYAYTAQALHAIEKLETHQLESLERLEQLTWLASGFMIQCIETGMQSKGIDTEEDLRAVTSMIAAKEETGG